MSALAKGVEHRPVGARHEGLAAEPIDQIEEGGAASLIEMGGDFVEQQHRGVAGHIPDEPCMREHQADEQRLLLAGRATLGLDVLFPVADQEIAAVRPVQRAARGRIAGTALGEHCQISLFEFKGGNAGTVIEKAGERQACGRKGPIAPAPLDEGREQAEHLLTGKRHGDAEPGHFALDGRQPGGIGPEFREKPVAAAHGAVELAGAAAVFGIERQDQPVEKAPAVGGRAGEEAIHRRSEPQHPEVIGEFVDRAGRSAVDPEAP